MGNDNVNGYDLGNEEIITTAEPEPDTDEGNEGDGK